MIQTNRGTVRRTKIQKHTMGGELLPTQDTEQRLVILYRLHYLIVKVLIQDILS